MLNSQQHAMPPGQQPNQGASGSITSPQSKTYKGLQLGFSYSHMTQDMREIYFAMTPAERAEYQRRTRDLRAKEDTEFKATVSETDRIVEEIKIDTTNIKTGVQQVLEKLDKQKKPVSPGNQPDKKEEDKKDSWLVRTANKIRKHNAKIDAKLEAVKYIVSSIADRAGQIIKWLPTLWVMLATLVRALEDLWTEIILPKIEKYVSPVFNKLKSGFDTLKGKVDQFLKNVQPILSEIKHYLFPSKGKLDTVEEIRASHNAHRDRENLRIAYKQLQELKDQHGDIVRFQGKNYTKQDRDRFIELYSETIIPTLKKRALQSAEAAHVTLTGLSKFEPKDTSVVDNTGDVIVEQENITIQNIDSSTTVTNNVYPMSDTLQHN